MLPLHQSPLARPVIVVSAAPRTMSGVAAGVVELVDTPALGAGAARRGGSSPFARMTRIVNSTTVGFASSCFSHILPRPRLVARVPEYGGEGAHGCTQASNRHSGPDRGRHDGLERCG